MTGDMLLESEDLVLINAFWHSFKQHAGVEHDRFTVTSFGDSEAMADALAALVVAGRKRATAGLHRDYLASDEPLPKPGDLFIITNGKGEPRCVCRTTEVRIGPFISVDAQFAYDEGEGDRSLAYWLAEHRSFFQRMATLGKFVMHDDLATIFQRFTVIWPAASDDKPQPQKRF